MSSTPGIDLRDRVGDDLAGLVEGLGSLPVAVAPLTALPYRDSERAAYRIAFADGRCFKGRCLESAERAAQIQRALSLAGHPMLPRVLGRRGSALLLDWVDGTSSPTPEQEPDVLRRCAEFHAWLHARPLPEYALEHGYLSFPVREASVRESRLRLRANIERLGEHGVGDLEGLEEIADSKVSRREVRGLVHGDLAGENVVISRQGRPRIVDNESMGLGFAAYDLARTWYRWPMDPAQRERYVAAYARRRRLDDFRDGCLFWLALATTDAAVYRFRRAPPVARPAVESLHRILRLHRRGASGDEALRAL